MIYYNSSDYRTRYYIKFADMDGRSWIINIQDPAFSGSPTELTGAASPIEWDGVGNEDQEKVVLGSTGYIRIVVRDGEEGIFTSGNVLPDVINDRRVQVLCNLYGSDYQLMWQGFIKPEEYSQDWDSEPYEIELPIVSVVAAAEFFHLPDYEDLIEVSNIADLLRYAITLMGCDITRIITNKIIYEDYNGNYRWLDDGVSRYPAHWSEGEASCLYFYTFENDGIKPKTIKDVFETVCYPYGKVQDYGTNIAIMMRADRNLTIEHKLFQLSVNDNSARFVPLDGDALIHELDLADDIQVNGNDNNYSLISRPSSVSFSNNIKPNKEIFELNEKYIKTTFSPTYPAPDLIDSWDDKVRCIVQLREDEVRNSWYKDLRYYRYNTDYEKTNIFCRVVDVNKVEDSDPARYTYNLLCPLALAFDPDKAFGFTLKNKVRTKATHNKIRITLGSYGRGQKEHWQMGAGGNISLRVHDITSNKWYDLQDKTWKDITGTSADWVWPSLDFADYDGGNYILTINEPRSSSDTKMHELQFNFRLFGYFAQRPKNSGWLTFNVEYGQDDSLNQQNVVNTLSDSLVNAGSSEEYGGSGENLNIDFPTMCGRNYIILNGAADIPFNSFCDSRYYIDTENRKKIVIGAAKFQTYEGRSFFYDMVTSYALIYDGNDVYIPVAIGMNPRNSTVKLTLVSTNVSAPDNQLIDN